MFVKQIKPCYKLKIVVQTIKKTILTKIIISKRSMTYSGNDTSWTSSKLNGLIRSTTMSLGNKVKNVATNIAKDLNESMKESIAYYANEVCKYSIGFKNINSIFCGF